MWTKSLLHSSRAHFDTWKDSQSSIQQGEIPLIKVTGNSLERDGTAESGHGPLGPRGEAPVHGASSERQNNFSDAAEETASNTSDGDYSEVNNTPRRQSDLESVRTEDFEDKFKQITNMPGPQEGERATSKERKRSVGLKRDNHVSEEALKLHESRLALLAAENSKKRGPGSKSKHHHHYGSHSQSQRHHNHLQNSDLESLTDDVESHIHNFLLKQVALSSNNGLDKLIDSDLETVKSLMVHKKFRRALYESGMTDPSELSSSETESIDDILASRKSGLPMTSEGPHSLPGTLRPYSLKAPEVKSKSHKHRRSPKGGRDGSRKDVSEDHLSLQTKKILQELEKEQMMQTCGQQMLHSAAGKAQGLMTSSTKLSGSTPDLSVPPKDPHFHNGSQMQHYLYEGSRLHNDVDQTWREKQAMLQELKSIAGVLERNKSELRQVERQVRDARNKAAEAKNELVLVEFQRDSCHKEIEKMAEQMGVLKGHFVDASAESLPFDSEQIAALLAENENLKVKLQGQISSESAAREVKELERQLNSAKEELFAEQRSSREKLESMEEELEQKTQSSESLAKENETLQKKLAHLETAHQQMERDKSKVIKEKTLAYEELRIGSEIQLSDLRMSSSNEIQELRNQLSGVTKQLTKSNGELTSKEEQNTKLREQIQDLQTELTQEGDAKTRMNAEAKRNLETTRMDMETAITEIRRTAEEDKTNALENQKRRLEAKHQERMAQTEQNLMKQLQEVQNYLAAREVEVELLKDRLKQNEEITKQARDKLRHDTHEKVKQALEEERHVMLKAKDEEIELQVNRLQEEYQCNIERMRHELTVEKDTVDQYCRQIKSLKKELEDSREQNRQLYRDKLHAVEEARESLEEERERQLVAITEQVERENSKQMDRLKDLVEKQEEEIDKLKTDKQQCLARERELVSTQEKFERSMVSELNEECSKISNIMGITPRTVTLPGYSAVWSNKNSNNVQNPIKNAIKTALSNLRALIQENSLYIKRIKQEADALRQTVVKTESSKSEEIDGIRQKLTSEKAQGMEMLRDRLVKEHTEELDRLHKSLNRGKDVERSLQEKDLELKEIQQNMSRWREEMAEKLAKKFQEEMSRELEKRLKDHKKQERDWEREKAELRREIDKIDREKRLYSMNGVSGYSTPIRHRAPSPVIMTPHSPSRNLIDSTKARDDAYAIKRRGLLTSSLSDLTANHILDTGNLANRSSGSETELKMASVERRAKFAEDRASKNEKELSRKISEVAKLQGSLTQQTKEYMQLKKAFSNMHQSALSPTTRTATR